MQALRDTPGTYLHADLVGWSWPASLVDLATISAAQTTVNANRDTKKHPEPIQFVWPWTGAEEAAEEVTDEERQALKATLNQHSAFH